jgi:hypothetical protein
VPEEAPELTAASPKRIGRRKTSASRILPGPGRFPTRDARGWISPTQLDAPEGVAAMGGACHLTRLSLVKGGMSMGLNGGWRGYGEGRCRCARWLSRGG